MSVWEIIAIGIALSMDACTITIANCTITKGKLPLKKQWSMPIMFALFQGIMPLLGYFTGSLFSGYLQTYGGYITSGIFFILALKIVWDIVKGLRTKQTEEKQKKLSFGLIVIQAIATSIDAFIIGATALVIGLTFSVFIATLIIALTTFILVAITTFLGKYLGNVLGKYASYVGAIILFALAIKELIVDLA